MDFLSLLSRAAPTGTLSLLQWSTGAFCFSPSTLFPVVLSVVLLAAGVGTVFGLDASSLMHGVVAQSEPVEFLALGVGILLTGEMDPSVFLITSGDVRTGLRDARTGLGDVWIRIGVDFVDCKVVRLPTFGDLLLGSVGVFFGLGGATFTRK